MKIIYVSTLILFSPIVHAEKYYPTDNYGNRKYGQTAYEREGDRLLPIDNFGNRRSSITFFKIDGNKVSPTDAHGNMKQNENFYHINKNGRINATDRFGNRKFEDLKIEGNKIVPVDSFGNHDPKRLSYIRK